MLRLQRDFKLCSCHLLSVFILNLVFFTRTEYLFDLHCSFVGICLILPAAFLAQHFCSDVTAILEW